MRLIFVPQYPSAMRYQEWWYKEFPRELRPYFDGVTILGEGYISREESLSSAKKEMFSPIEKAIELESYQINEYKNSFKRLPPHILFVSDLSFPGFFSNVLYHYKPHACFIYCHGTSLNYLDYFANDRISKSKIEHGHALLYNKVFIASDYHKKKLGWKNTEIVRLPKPPFDPRIKFDKKYDIVSVARPTPQKVTKATEEFVEQEFGNITRRNFKNWNDYYSFLGESKVLLITTKEDTFNYTVIDAVTNGCIPVAPNNFAFPEILPKEYLYDNKEELKEILKKCLNGDLEIPKILCQEEIDNFYRNIYKIIREESEIKLKVIKHPRRI